ncbi:MAG: aminotransferase class I/II-fold pyridoxal phosphate-dependent enzyme [Patescibacteria group bacterium]
MSMFSYFKPISTALLPNAELDDIKIVLKLFLPWNWSKWQEGKEIGELENKFKEYFGVKHAISFSSGRAGLYAILKSLILQYPISNIQYPEVIAQAFTTIAIPNAIKQAGFKTVYIDIKEDTYNIDPDKIEEKITANTKAIIVQHTFGVPAEMDKILAFCKKHNLLLIEDCAHSLGAEFGGKKAGTFGGAAFFSFGRDKIISSTSGGMVITSDNVLADEIKKFQSILEFPSKKWILQQLAHPLVFWFSLPIYYFFNIGKLKIFLAQKLGIISRAYSEAEKKGIGNMRGYRLPNALAVLALNQFKKLERFNNHRRKIAEIYDKSFHYDNMNYHSGIDIGKTDKNSFYYHTLEYDSRVNNVKNEQKISHFGNWDNQSEIKLPLNIQKNKSVFLYYTIQVERRDELLKFAAKKHIILGDWFPGALGPKGVNEEKFGYKKGACPIAERVGLKSLNLPTNIRTSEKDAKKVADLIKKFLNKK